MNVTKDHAKLFCGVLSALLSGLFFGACIKLPSLQNAIAAHTNLNLAAYAGSLFLFCIAYLILFRLFSSFDFLWMKRPVFGKFFFAAFIFGSILFLSSAFLMEEKIQGGVAYKYIWHKLPPVLILILSACSIFLFFAIWKFRELPVSNIFWWVYYAALTLLAGYTFYTPNIFGRGELGDSAHANAYYNSIYNIYQGSVVTKDTSSIYGHYAFFFKFPMKLAHGSFKAYVLMIAFLGALCFLCAFLTLHLLCSNTMLRVLGCIAMSLPILSMRGGYYWQLWPHRIIFPCLLTLFTVFCLKKRRMSYHIMVLGYLLSLLAILWNTESGLFCAVSWAATWILAQLCSRENNIGSFLVNLLVHCLGILFAFLGAFGLTNAYNWLKHGPVVSMDVFLFPLNDNSYMTDVLHLDMPLFPALYMLAILLFLAAAARGFSYMQLFPENKNRTAPIPVAALAGFYISILSLGQLTYFINRPAYHNLDIIHIPAILLLAVLAQEGLSHLTGGSLLSLLRLETGRIVRGSAALLSVGLLFIFSLGTVVQYSYNADIKTVYHDTSSLDEFTATIAAEVPKDTYAFGVSVAEIYSILGWNTGCFTLDFTDLSVYPEAADHIIEDLQTKNMPYVFTGQGTIEKFKNFSPTSYNWFDGNYMLIKEYQFSGSTFRLYQHR